MAGEGGNGAQVIRSSRRLRALIENLKSAILVEDEARRIVLVNQEFCEMFGVDADPDSLVGTECADAAEQSKPMFLEPEAMVARIDALLEAREVCTGDELRHVDGRVFERDFIPVFDGDVHIGHMWHFRDVTERVATLEALQRSNRELEQFAYVVAHDLRSPLQTITGMGELLERATADRLTESEAMMVQRVIEGGRRMDRMLSDLLTYSCIRSSRAPTSVSLQAVCDEALENLEAEITRQGAVVSCTALPTVSGSKTQLVQVFQNLIGNALKFRGTAPPNVQIGAARKGARWEIHVSDNGPGIPPQDALRIFRMFERMPDASVEGTGLGLALVRKIVECHGGTVWLDAEVQRGATFRLSLPVDSGSSSDGEQSPD